MKWIIGRLVFKISNLLTRFVNQYIIYCFAEHGENCHIDGKCCVSAKNIHIGNNVFIAGGQLLFLQMLKYILEMMLCLDQMCQ